MVMVIPVMLVPAGTLFVLSPAEDATLLLSLSPGANTDPAIIADVTTDSIAVVAITFDCGIHLGMISKYIIQLDRKYEENQLFKVIYYLFELQKHTIFKVQWLWFTLVLSLLTYRNFANGLQIH